MARLSKARKYQINQIFMEAMYGRTFDIASALDEAIQDSITDNIIIPQEELDAALLLKEDNTNKSTDTSLGTSNTLYPTQNAVKTYVDNAVGPRRVKKTTNIQLDTPSPNPTITAGGSHTYMIDLGAEYSQIAITNFSWVLSQNNNNNPDAVLATAAFPHEVYNGVLIATTQPGGWLRCFEVSVPEFQDGSPTDVAASYSSDSSEVSAPLGYGSAPLEVPLDHTALQTSPPKKLQIEDVWLEGNFLKVIIKNYDSVSLTLSPYVGVTALFDEERNANMGAVAENGTLAYTAFLSGNIRLSEDAGKTFKTYFPSKNIPSDPVGNPLRNNGIAATSDSVNTFIGLFNYSYVKVAQSPDYIFQNRYYVPTLGANFSASFFSGNFAQKPYGGKVFDWKKTLSESCALFSGFMNYYAIQVYKSVDDCVSFGNNSPNFDNNLPIFNSDGLVTSDLPDFGDSNMPNGNLEFLKAQVKVINNNTHYLALSYWSKDEDFYNGLSMPDVFLGPQIITGVDSIPFQLRATEVAFVKTSYFNSAFGKFKIENSSMGNNSTCNTYSGVPAVGIPIYYTGSGVVGPELVTIYADEVVVKSSDFSPLNAITGDLGRISTLTSNNWASICGIRTATIEGESCTIIKLGTISDGATSVSYFSFPYQNGYGLPLSGEFLEHWGEATGRYFIINGKSYWVFGQNTQTYLAESSSVADPLSTSNVKATFITPTGTQKQKLLKTTDGGATWTSVMEHPEFRYSPASVFFSSNDGQTLMLAALKYWTGIAYEKWPYSENPSELGSYARFNISTDGGTTWRNASGSWDYLGKNLVNVRMESSGPYISSGRTVNGQVLGKISNEVLAILYDDNGLPVLYRSTDNGITWGSPIILKTPVGGTGNGFQGYGSDSKDSFMGFFGHFYSTTSDQYLYYGSLVSEYTQWKGFGVPK